MAIKDFYGGKFDHHHEIQQYREVRSLIEESYGSTDEPVYLLFNVQLEHQIDLIILMRNVITVLELKSLRGKIVGSENGESWAVVTKSGEKKPVNNLFNQLHNHKFDVINLLNRALDLETYKIQAWGYFKNGSSYDKSQIQNKNQLMWFDVVWKDTLLEKIRKVKKSDFELQESDMKSIVAALNLSDAKYLDLEENLKLANEECVKGNYTKVREYANKALEIDTEDMNSWNYRGLGFLGLQELDEAEKAFDNTLYFDRGHAPSLYNKGVVLFKMCRFEDALNLFEEFLDRCKELSYSKNSLSNGVFFEVKTQNNDSILKSAATSAWVYMGDCLFELVDDPLRQYEAIEESIKNYDRALELDPYSIRVLEKKALACYYDCDDDMALQCIDTIHDIDSDFAPAYYNKGLLLAPDELEEAIKCFDEFIIRIERISKTNDTILEGKFFPLNHNHKVIENFRELNDISSEAWYQKGWIQREIGKYREAIECFDRALEIDPHIGEKTDLLKLRASCNEK